MHDDRILDAFFAGLKLSGGGSLTAPPVENNKDNKRLHIKFNNPDIFLPIQIRTYRMEDVFQKKILASVWNSFGTVTDTFYH
jgi:hypothetical protein